VTPSGDDAGGDGRRRSGRRSSEPLQRISLGPPRADDDAPAEPTRRPRKPTARSPGLDRIRPREVPDGGGAGAVPPDLEAPATERDPLGRAALFSSATAERPSSLGTFLIECSACRRETPVTAGDLVRLGLPSLHMPFVKRYPSLMRCPACGRRTWVRVRWRL
jgi:hypothetical protein